MDVPENKTIVDTLHQPNTVVQCTLDLMDMGLYFIILRELTNSVIIHHLDDMNVNDKSLAW